MRSRLIEHTNKCMISVFPLKKITEHITAGPPQTHYLTGISQVSHLVGKIICKVKK
jgi:hypothetical protein